MVTDIEFNDVNKKNIVHRQNKFVISKNVLNNYLISNALAMLQNKKNRP